MKREARKRLNRLMTEPSVLQKPTPPVNLWEQMDALLGDRIQDDPGFSIGEFATRYRLSDSHARKTLNDLVRRGSLIEGKRKSEKRLIKVYRPA